MADATNLPLIPGSAPPRLETLPVAGLSNPLPPHRPDPGTDRSERAGGDRIWTDRELLDRSTLEAEHDAEIDARDGVSAGSGAALHVPAFLALLVTIIQARIQRECPVDPTGRAEARSMLRIAQAKVKRAQDELARLEIALRRARAALREEGSPALGTGFTGETSSLAVIALFGLVEAVLAGNGLQAATGINAVLAQALGMCIAVILVLVFKGFGSAIGALVGNSKRATWMVAVVLGASVLVSGVAYVYTVTGSRSENQAIVDALVKGPISEDGKLGTARSDRDSVTAPAERDLTFMIPLQALLMVGSALMAMRIELARRYNEGRELIEDLEDDIDDARSAEAAAKAAQEQQSDEIETVDQRVAAHAENQNAFYFACAENYRDRYSRFCRAAGVEPREVAIPPAADPLDAAVRLVDPPLAAARERQRYGAAPHAAGPAQGGTAARARNAAAPTPEDAPEAPQEGTRSPAPAPIPDAPRPRPPAAVPSPAPAPRPPLTNDPAPSQGGPAVAGLPARPASTGRPAWMS